MKIILEKSTRLYKKFKISIDGKIIHFGDRRYNDYTTHPENIRDARKKLYILRHKQNENWLKRGIFTAGFWSRWLLWNKKNINESIADTEKLFNIKIISKL